MQLLIMKALEPITYAHKPSIQESYSTLKYFFKNFNLLTYFNYLQFQMHLYMLS